MSTPRCPMCSGKGTVLGSLGNAIAYRCRDCGWDWTKNKHVQRGSPAKHLPLPPAHARMYPGRQR